MRNPVPQKAEQTGSIAAANFGKVFPGDRSRVPSHSFQPVGSKRIEEGGKRRKGRVQLRRFSRYEMR